MLKIVYPICCGMDVHKNFVVACVATTDEENLAAYYEEAFIIDDSGKHRNNVYTLWSLENPEVYRNPNAVSDDELPLTIAKLSPCEGSVAPVSGLLQNMGQGHNRPNTRGFQAIFTK